MAKILVRGRPPSEKVAKHECSYCNSLIEYSKTDVKSDVREGDYVVCPVCARFISSVALVWS